MIRLTIFLCGFIWVGMAFSPDLDEPVFTESHIVAEAKIAPAIEPEVTRATFSDPVQITNPIVVAQVAPVSEAVVPEPVVVAAEIAPEPERIIWYVTGSRVNVREGPSTSHAILGKVLRGDAAEIISDPDAEWVRIRIEGDGVEGFIVKRLMTDVDPLG